MDTESIIRELERVEKKHKHDKVFTGQLNIAEMARDVRKRIEELKPYEDTGLTPQEIMGLKKRDTAKAPEIHKNKYSYVYTCANCALVLINKDETGWFCGKRYAYCPDCGQKIKWEE